MTRIKFKKNTLFFDWRSWTDSCSLNKNFTCELHKLSNTRNKTNDMDCMFMETALELLHANHWQVKRAHWITNGIWTELW